MNTENLDAILVYLGSLVERTDKWSAQALPILGREVVLKGLISSSASFIGLSILNITLLILLRYLNKKRQEPGADSEDYIIPMVIVGGFALMFFGISMGELVTTLQHIFTPNAVLLDYVMTKLGK